MSNETFSSKSLSNEFTSNESIISYHRLTCSYYKPDNIEVIYQLLNELGLSLVNKIGRGCFGIIFGAMLTINTLQTLQESTPFDDWSIDEMASKKKKMVAIKIVGDVDNEEMFYHFWTEMNALKLIAHPNIVRHYGYFQVFARSEQDSYAGVRFRVNNKQYPLPPIIDERMYFTIFMERLGDNLDTICTRLDIDYFNEEETLHIFRQIGLALAYMHEMYAITHNQIKLANIAISCFGKQIQRKDLINHSFKLIHFGEATLSNDYEYCQALNISANTLGWPISNKFQYNRFEQQSLNIVDEDAGGSNVFLQEAFNFGQMLLKKSNLETSTTLKEAIVMMSNRYENNRITVADAILLIEKKEMNG